MEELQCSREVEMENLRDQLKRVESFHDERERRDMDTPQKTPLSDARSQTDTNVMVMRDFSDGPQAEVQANDDVFVDADTDEIPPPPPPPPSAPPPDVPQKDEEIQVLHDEIKVGYSSLYICLAWFVALQRFVFTSVKNLWWRPRIRETLMCQKS